MLSLAEREVLVMLDNYEHVRVIALWTSAWMKAVGSSLGQNRTRLRVFLVETLLQRFTIHRSKPAKPGALSQNSLGRSRDDAIIVSSL